MQLIIDRTSYMEKIEYMYLRNTEYVEFDIIIAEYHA